MSAPAIETEAHSPLPQTAGRVNLRQVAGAYSFGNGLNLNFEIIITPDGQFSYQQASYEGVEAEAAGSALIKDGKVVLRPTTATPEAWPEGMGLQLVPVRWSGRQYLVPDKDIMAFVNAVNRGTEPVQQVSRGAFFLREGDWDKPVTGRPELPSSYTGLLLRKPVRGKVLASEHGGLWKVDMGRRCGLQPGMELCAWSPDNAQCVTLVVAYVEDNCCMVKNRRGPIAPLLNWKVCSRERYE